MKNRNYIFTLFLLFVCTSAALAGNLSIKVNKRNANGGSGIELANATVCILSDDTYQQGVTNANGKATFLNVPAGNYTATATKIGFTGQSITFNFNGSDTTQFITLPEGAGGPVCSAPPPKPDFTILMAQSPNGSVSTEDIVAYPI